MLIHRRDDELRPGARSGELADHRELDARKAAAPHPEHRVDECGVEPLLPLHVKRRVRAERARQLEVPIVDALARLDVVAQAELVDDRL